MAQIVVMAALLAAITVCGRLVARLRIPPVIGTMTAGVLLGMALGSLAPAVPVLAGLTDSGSVLTGVAAVAITVFMTEIGFGLRTRSLAGAGLGSGGRWVASSSLITLVPLATGVLLAPLTWPAWGMQSIPFPVFALAQGCLFTVTAVPVLQRVLVEFGYARTAVGYFALTQSLITECIVWLCVVVLVSVGTNDGVLAALLKSAALIGIGLCSRWACELLIHRLRDGYRDIAVGSILLGGATLAMLSGVSPVIAGFVIGLMLRNSGSLEQSLRRLAAVNLRWLFPFFFVGVGIAIGPFDLGASWSPGSLWIPVAVLAAAFAAKWVAAWGGGLLSGLRRRAARQAATLLSLRGATELALVAVLAEARILSTEGLRMFVAFAVLSTILAVGMAMVQNRRAGATG